MNAQRRFISAVVVAVAVVLAVLSASTVVAVHGAGCSSGSATLETERQTLRHLLDAKKPVSAANPHRYKSVVHHKSVFGYHTHLEYDVTVSPRVIHVSVLTAIRVEVFRCTPTEMWLHGNVSAVAGRLIVVGSLLTGGLEARCTDPSGRYYVPLMHKVLTVERTGSMLYLQTEAAHFGQLIQSGSMRFSSNHPAFFRGPASASGGGIIPSVWNPSAQIARKPKWSFFGGLFDIARDVGDAMGDALCGVGDDIVGGAEDLVGDNSGAEQNFQSADSDYSSAGSNLENAGEEAVRVVKTIGDDVYDVVDGIAHLVTGDFTVQKEKVLSGMHWTFDKTCASNHSSDGGLSITTESAAIHGDLSFDATGLTAELQLEIEGYSLKLFEVSLKGVIQHQSSIGGQFEMNAQYIWKHVFPAVFSKSIVFSIGPVPVYFKVSLPVGLVLGVQAAVSGDIQVNHKMVGPFELAVYDNGSGLHHLISFGGGQGVGGIDGDIQGQVTAYAQVIPSLHVSLYNHFTLAGTLSPELALEVSVSDRFGTGEGNSEMGQVDLMFQMGARATFTIKALEFFGITLLGNHKWVLFNSMLIDPVALANYTESFSTPAGGSQSGGGSGGSGGGSGGGNVSSPDSGNSTSSGGHYMAILVDVIPSYGFIQQNADVNVTIVGMGNYSTVYPIQMKIDSDQGISVFVPATYVGGNIWTFTTPNVSESGNYSISAFSEDVNIGGRVPFSFLAPESSPDDSNYGSSDGGSSAGRRRVLSDETEPSSAQVEVSSIRSIVRQENVCPYTGCWLATGLSVCKALNNKYVCSRPNQWADMEMSILNQTQSLLANGPVCASKSLEYMCHSMFLPCKQEVSGVPAVAGRVPEFFVSHNAELKPILYSECLSVMDMCAMKADRCDVALMSPYGALKLDSGVVHSQSTTGGSPLSSLGSALVNLPGTCLAVSSLGTCNNLNGMHAFLYTDVFSSVSVAEQFIQSLMAKASASLNTSGVCTAALENALCTMFIPQCNPSDGKRILGCGSVCAKLQSACQGSVGSTEATAFAETCFAFESFARQYYVEDTETSSNGGCSGVLAAYPMTYLSSSTLADISGPAGVSTWSSQYGSGSDTSAWIGGGFAIGIAVVSVIGVLSVVVWRRRRQSHVIGHRSQSPSSSNPDTMTLNPLSTV